MVSKYPYFLYVRGTTPSLASLLAMTFGQPRPISYAVKFWWKRILVNRINFFNYTLLNLNNVDILIFVFHICRTSRDLLYKVIFQDPDCRNAVCWAEKYPETKEPDTLISFSFGSTQSQEKRPQGLDLGRSTASNQAIANLRPRLQRWSSELQFILLPQIFCCCISGSCLEYDVIPSKPENKGSWCKKYGFRNANKKVC